MATMTVSEARAALPELLNRVLAGEEVTITRHGQPVAVVVRPDALRVRRSEAALTTAAEVTALLSRSRPPAARGSKGGLSARRARELIGEIRADRDSS
jgi:antitoxin (DNA-binding transcriptional repressor) of toxin-antitoxin stability system